MSDVHAPMAESARTWSTLQDGRTPVIAPLGLVCDTPSFVCATGDCTEFGGPAGWKAFWRPCTNRRLPVYALLGNHDSTWRTLQPEFAAQYGGLCYAVEFPVARLLVLDSASPQDPRPAFTVETLRWLERELRRGDPDLPVIVAFHHPLDSREFASRYERDRLLDLMAPYPVRLALVGHRHAFRTDQWDWLTGVGGGSTFGPDRGWNVIDLRAGWIRVGVQRADEAQAGKVLLDEPLAPPARPQVSILSPLEGDRVSDGFTVSAALDSGWTVRAARVIGEDGASSPLSPVSRESADAPPPSGAAADSVTFRRTDAECWTGAAPPCDGAPGYHAFRVEFEIGETGDQVGSSGNSMTPPSPESPMDQGGRTPPDNPVRPERARLRVAGESKGDSARWPFDSAVADGDHLAQGGRMDPESALLVVGRSVVVSLVPSAGFGATTPAIRWRASLGASVRAACTVGDGTLFVATTEGTVSALDVETGDKRWTSRLGGACLGAPCLRAADTLRADPGGLYVGSLDGTVTALDPETGAARYRVSVGGPVAAGVVGDDDRLYACDLDGGVTAFDPADGRVRWQRHVAAGAIESTPALVDGVLYLTAWDTFVYAVDAATGTERWKSPSASTTVEKAAKYYSPADHTPIVTPDRVVVVDRGYRLTVFDRKTGRELKRCDDVIAATRTPGLGESPDAWYAKRASALVRWSNGPGSTEAWDDSSAPGYMPTPPVLCGGVLVSCTSTGLMSARLAESGAILWRWQATPGLYVMATPVTDGRNVYIAGMDGVVTAIEVK